MVVIFLNRPSSYGFKISDEGLTKLGNFLRELRNKNEAKFMEISKKTKIDIGTLNKLEKGDIHRINPFMLKELADFYKINVLTFFILTGYVNMSEIIDFYEENNKDSTSLVINNKKDLDIFFNSLFYSNSITAYNFSDEMIVLYDFDYQNFINGDSFIFKYNNEIIISEYYEYENIFFIKNIISNVKFFLSEDEIKILGKVIYTLKINKITQKKD